MPCGYAENNQEHLSLFRFSGVNTFFQYGAMNKVLKQRLVLSQRDRPSGKRSFSFANERTRVGWRKAVTTILAVPVLLAGVNGQCAPVPGGTVLSNTPVDAIRAADIASWFSNAINLPDTEASTIAQAQIAARLLADAGIAKCDVEIRQIQYTTTDPHGEATSASGAILLPRQPPGATTCPNGPQPMVAYTPATETQKERVLADKDSIETGILSGLFAAQGYVVVMTDNLGLGLSTFPYHPYLNSDVEAASLIDAIRAAKRVLAAEGLTTSKLFVTGYSQGGHSAMATARALETRYASEFPEFTASMPSSGPYALETAFIVDIAGNNPETVDSALYALTGWQKTYGNLYNDPTDMFNAPFASVAENYLPISDAAPPSMPEPATMNELLTANFRGAFLADPGNPSRIAARLNSFVGSAAAPIDPNAVWSPTKPMMLCGAEGDTTVSFALSGRAAFNVFATQLHKPVTARDFQPELAAARFPPSLFHAAAMPLCMREARDYFESLNP